MSGHYELIPYCRITYWQDGVAASVDEDWTVCKISMRGMSVSELSFENTEDDHRLMSRVLSFMAHAYEAGRADAKREIREVLGVKEPRP